MILEWFIVLVVYGGFVQFVRCVGMLCRLFNSFVALVCSAVCSILLKRKWCSAFCLLD